MSTLLHHVYHYRTKHLTYQLPVQAAPQGLRVLRGDFTSQQTMSRWRVFLENKTTPRDASQDRPPPQSAQRGSQMSRGVAIREKRRTSTGHSPTAPNGLAEKKDPPVGRHVDGGEQQHSATLYCIGCY